MKKYSLGCAFSFDDLILNFPYKSLKFTCKDAYALTKDNHRDVLIKRIFIYHVEQVINDIIDNNVTFDLPLVGTKKCNIHMKRVRGEDFKRLRRAGKWQNVDIISSMFCGYQLSIYLLGYRVPRIKSIYLNKKFTDRITENTNKGMAYGDGKINTTVKDYIDDVCKAFPTICKSDIDRILKFCWKSVYLLNSYGGDVLLKNNSIWCYMGNLKRDSLQHYTYYIRKLSIRLRVLYKRKKIEWDGYYYFALSDLQYLNYLALKNKKGRPKKRFNYGDVFLYLIKDECRLRESNNKYIFRVPFISKLNFKQYVLNFISDKAELIEVREPLKFKDILVDNNKYEAL